MKQKFSASRKKRKYGQQLEGREYFSRQNMFSLYDKFKSPAWKPLGKFSFPGYKGKSVLIRFPVSGKLIFLDSFKKFQIQSH
jgi:hypothetical protein